MTPPSENAGVDSTIGGVAGPRAGCPAGGAGACAVTTTAVANVRIEIPLSERFMAPPRRIGLLLDTKLRQMMVEMLCVQAADLFAAHTSHGRAVGPAIAKRLRGERIDETEAAIALGGKIVAVLLRNPSAPCPRALRPRQVQHDELQQGSRKRDLLWRLRDEPERTLHRFVDVPQHLADRHLPPLPPRVGRERLDAAPYFHPVSFIVQHGRQRPPRLRAELTSLRRGKPAPNAPLERLARLGRLAPDAPISRWGI